MKKNSENKLKAFTIIELMISIFVTITVVGTFYKLYSNSIKAQRNTTVRSTVNIVGEGIIETIASSIRLLGLNNMYNDYNPGAGVSGSIITSAVGSDGTDAANFIFVSPYGGPISKLLIDAQGTDGKCTYTLRSSASLHSSIGKVVLMSKTGIYEGNVTSVAGNKIITDPTTPAFVGNCSERFPEGTLITGPNYDFNLTYVKGANTFLKLWRVLSTGVEDIFVDFSSADNSEYEIAFFVLHFLREYEDIVAGNPVIKREWFKDVTDSEEIKEIKAVRVGFVLVSQRDRVRKKVAGADAGISNEYCVFDGFCYTLNDQNKTAYTFRRVIHIRNYDYLGLNTDINYP